MTPQRFREIRQIFEAVVSLPAADRAKPLREIATRDPDLAGEVESLLHAHERRGTFIEHPALSLTGAVSAAEEKWAGPYRLLDLVGEGGMGQVWRAEQTVPVRRLVALKLIKIGMDTREVISRFESERRVLALMDHPAIARVFDAGATQDGRPYIAMEYVQGQPIHVYCQERCLSVRSRLKLFVRVCEGVQHAHQKAILHRDLKPGNILVTEVDGRPVPKIIDFGVARAMVQDEDDATMFTRAGSILGTPDYMSPEQAAGSALDVDTRTDVYSLGVILYELLAGALPLDLRGLSLPEMLQRVREADAPRPSARVRMLAEQPASAGGIHRLRALISELRGDLDAIALKALEKDRRLRYDSAVELAADINRHLNHEPVRARPAGAWYSASKYVRRHRMSVAAVTALALLAASFATWQAAELKRITRERDRADRITRFMTDMFRISDPGESRGNQVTARQILDRASAEIGNGLASDPELQAQLMDVMGRVYVSLGLNAEAESLLRRAAETSKRVLGTDHLATAQILNDLASALSGRGLRAETEQIDRQVTAIRLRKLGPDHPDTLKSMNNLSLDLMADGRYSEAERLQQTVLKTKQRTLGPEDRSTLQSMTNLGTTLGREGKLREAEALERTALEIRLRVTGEYHPETLSAQSRLAETLYDEGQYREAEALDRAVLAARTRVLGPEHADTLNAMIALANPLESQGRLAEAEKLDRTAIEIMRRTLGPEHHHTTLATNNLADVLAEEGKYTEAERLDREVMEIRSRQMGPSHPETLISSDRLAYVLMRRGSLQEADQIARQTRVLQDKQFGGTNPETASTIYTLACVAARLGQTSESIGLLREAVDHGLKPNVGLGIATDPPLSSLHGKPGFEDLVRYARQRAAGRI